MTLDDIETHADYITPRLARWKRVSDPLLLFLALGSVPVLLLEIDKASLPRGDQIFIDIVNIIVFAAFLVDYVVGLWLTSDRRAYARAEWLNLLIVVASAAAIAPDLGAFGSARALRGLRPLRAIVAVIRVLVAGGIAARDGRSMIRKNAVRFAMGTAGLTWFTAAAAFTVAEDVGVDRTFDGGFSDALWWAAATITTVGYGDIAPQTLAGRAIGVATMVVGISTFAIITARVASFLVIDD
jgi:voltage-gated potassium channel